MLTLTSSCQLELTEEFDEFIFVKINDEFGNIITIGAFYRSPSSSLENDNNLLGLLNLLNCKFPGRLLLIGDFNLPNIN